MSRTLSAAIMLLLAALAGCAASPPEPRAAFRYDYGGFADVGILAYPVPGFDELSSRQKELLYYLAQAGYAGRDIMYDQNYRHNLRVRRTLEAVVRHYEGQRQDPEFERFMTYTRQVWFSNGIHHHYSTLKLRPAFSAASFSSYVNAVAASGDLPLLPGENVDDLLAALTPVIFDPAVAPKRS